MGRGNALVCDGMVEAYWEIVRQERFFLSKTSTDVNSKNLRKQLKKDVPGARSHFDQSGRRNPEVNVEYEDRDENGEGDE